MKESLQSKLAKLVEGKAIDVTRNTVGKSLPHSIHEIKLPAELKEADLEDISL